MADEPKPQTQVRREELDAILAGFVGRANGAYFQPPPNITMEYPCIVYSWDDEDTLHANNKPYRKVRGYTVTVIDRDPDSPIPDKVSNLPLCSFDRSFKADNLNHSVYTLFF